MPDTCPTCARTHLPTQPCLRGVLLVCGGRAYSDWTTLSAALDRMAARMDVVALRHGGARGADALAHRWALDRGVLADPVPADWAAHGRAAGPIRNAAMLVRIPVPVACVAMPGGAGTRDMVRRCEEAGVPVWRVGWAEGRP